MLLSLFRLKMPQFRRAVFSKTKVKQNFQEDRQEKIGAADMRDYHLGYRARQMKRKFILHVGPTNSGKTHAALKHLSESASAIYCAPLRLLAAEVWDKLNNDHNVPCDLVTGQQRLLAPNSKHVSCTVEMADINNVVDVAVIDEYQLLASPDRGWAWTRAILGLQAKVIHLAGDPSQIKMIEILTSLTQDELEIIEYTRLSPLLTGKSLAGTYSNIREGDAVIAFSRRRLFEIKTQIELETKKKCCIVYGGLPPESRRKQAELFNDFPEEYPYLVATDAIGMGLNLNIRRVIFSELKKFDGNEIRPLTVSEIKQIGGRAGRYQSRYPKGYVASLDNSGTKKIFRALTDTTFAVPQQIYLLPSFEQLERFWEIYRPKKFSNLLKHFSNYAIATEPFVLADFADILENAMKIDHIPLSLKDRWMFCVAPVNEDEDYLVSLAETFAASGHVPFNLTSPGKLVRSWQMRKSRFGTKHGLLAMLEAHYKKVELYVWLALHFDVFDGLLDAQTNLEETAQVIDRTLAELGLLVRRPKKQKLRHLNKLPQKESGLLQLVKEEMD